MNSRLDAYLGMHARALQLSAKRTEVLAQNLANADTPNYKARDIDFQSALAAAMGAASNSALPMKTTNPAHVGDAGAAPAVHAPLKYRTPLAPALDGNTVDPQLEQAAFAQNSVRYEAELMFVGGMFKSLIRAITGQNSA